MGLLIPGGISRRSRLAQWGWGSFSVPAELVGRVSYIGAVVCDQTRLLTQQAGWTLIDLWPYADPDSPWLGFRIVAPAKTLSPSAGVVWLGLGPQGCCWQEGPFWGQALASYLCMTPCGRGQQLHTCCALLTTVLQPPLRARVCEDPPMSWHLFLSCDPPFTTPAACVLCWA